MASIVKRKSKYSVVYSYYDEQGEKKQKWETWGTMKEAKKRKAEIEYKQDNNTFVRPSIKTISDLMYDFVELYGVNKWALSTFDAKKGLIDNYINPIIGEVKITDVTPRMMDEYYKKLLKVKSDEENWNNQIAEQNERLSAIDAEIEKLLSQAESLEQIGQGIEQLSDVVQGTASSSEENTAISINLAEGAAKMHDRVNVFKLF